MVKWSDKKLNKEFGPITNQWIKDNSMGSTDFVSDDKISKYKNFRNEIFLKCLNQELTLNTENNNIKFFI